VSHIDIVFDGPPGPVAGRFVEVEDANGWSFNAGEWLQRPDGYWVLRIQQPHEPAAEPGSPEAMEVFEECRLQFEDWANEKGMTLDTDFFSSNPNNYVDPDTHLAFEIWTASRASLTKPAVRGRWESTGLCGCTGELTNGERPFACEHGYKTELQQPANGREQQP
jgi:hypothetical protein